MPTSRQCGDFYKIANHFLRLLCLKQAGKIRRSRQKRRLVLAQLSLYKKHVFVCVTGKTCPDQGSQPVLEALKNEIREQGLKKSIRINKSGCLGQCGNGPMVVVYPEGHWYHAVKVSDCSEIVKSDLIGHKVVKRLVYANPE